MKRLLVASLVLLNLPFIAFASTPPDAIKKAKVMNKAYRMQIPFIENKGQIGSDEVSFYTETFGGTLFVEENGNLIYDLLLEHKKRGLIVEDFSDERVSVRGLDPSSTKMNYFKGNDQSKWRTNISTYNTISLGEVYKGVELTLKAYGNTVEKIFAVSPGESPEKIRIKLYGAIKLKTNSHGELEVITESSSVKFSKPIAYQEIDGKKVNVAASYKLFNPQHNAPDSLVSYGFNVSNYNNSYPLIIDPLLASTFIGGSGADDATSITVDESGNVFITGTTHSSDYPITPGAYDDSESLDVFISKLDSTLSTLLASTFIGGYFGEYCRGIALDENGNVYIAGTTYSSDYPTTPGAYDRTDNNSTEIFISKLDSNLSTLLASTYIGGDYIDEGYSIALSGSGNVYIAGRVYSSSYPTTFGAYDRIDNGRYDTVVSKLDSNLSTLLASTYIGGSDDDMVTSLKLDGGGNVCILGYTKSSNYPITAGAFQENRSGSDDVFISKLDSTLSLLWASTFIGGTDGDIPYAFTFDSVGNIYITGTTYSSDYPTTPGAYDSKLSGDTDGFISRIDSSLTTLLASTYIGGVGRDSGTSISIDERESVFVTGYTYSSNYPTTPGAYDRTSNGSYDAFISKLTSTLTTLAASTFIGGSGEDVGNAIISDESGRAYVTGSTSSPNYPAFAGAYDASYNGDDDVFILKIDSQLTLGISVDDECEWDDEFSQGESVYGVAGLDLLPNTSYPLYIVNHYPDWTNGMPIPTFCIQCVTLPEVEFTTNENGDMGCDTLLWQGAQAGTLPSYFDIVIDVDRNGMFDSGTDFLDAYPTGGFKICSDNDADTICDDEDNCPEAHNADQGDVDGDGLGDACDPDIDNDGICNPGEYDPSCSGSDNCPYSVNSDQNDGDGDNIGNVCDNCPYDFNTDQDDGDFDDIGNVCDNNPNVFNPFPSADGHYESHDYCHTYMFGNCQCEYSSTLDDNISVGYEYGTYWPYGNCEYYIDQYTGIMEFDISSTESLFTGGQIEAQLQLTVSNVHSPYDICLSFYSIEDGYENGIIEGVDTDTADFIGEVCGNLFAGDTIILDVTSAVVHDLFDTDQTDFSGFIIERSTSWYDYIQFYDHSDAENGPRLTIINKDPDDDGISSEEDNCPDAYNPDQVDADGDCMGDACDPDPNDPDNPVITVDADSDNITDACDNCPVTPNNGQTDTYPPGGNKRGDACDCEGDFSCDGDVDGSDASTFKADFGRSVMVHPCVAGDTCNGDFSCDGDVDGTDASLFKQDFGRSSIQNPCPACVVGEWCTY